MTGHAKEHAMCVTSSRGASNVCNGSYIGKSLNAQTYVNNEIAAQAAGGA